MDKLTKLFQKITSKERKQLLSYSTQLEKSTVGFNVKKLKGSDFYRARKGRWRFIFHYEGDEIVVDSIRLRDEKTYRDI